MLRHKKDKISIEQSIANINKILCQLKELLQLSNDEKIISRLKTLEDTVEYCNPSTDMNINYLDNRISNLFGDLKIQIVSKQPRNHIDYKIESIEALVIERNAKA